MDLVKPCSLVSAPPPRSHTEVLRAPSGDPADTDYMAVGCAVTTISSNLTEMSKGVKLLAALMEDEGANGQQLLGAAKNLATAVSTMLKTAQPSSTEVCLSAPHGYRYATGLPLGYRATATLQGYR